MPIAPPEAIVKKYDLKEDLKKLGLNEKDGAVKLLLETDKSKRCIVDEKFFLESLQKIIASRHKYTHVTTQEKQVLQDIEKKLLITLSEEERSLAGMNAKFGLQNVDPKKPDLTSIKENEAYNIYRSKDPSEPIARVISHKDAHGQDTLTMTMYKPHSFSEKLKAGSGGVEFERRSVEKEKNETKCFGSLAMVAVAKFGEGATVRNPYFDEAKFLRSKATKTNAGKAYFHQQRDLMVTAIANGLKIDPSQSSLLDKKDWDKAQKMREELIDQRKLAAKSTGTSPAAMMGGAASTAATATPTVTITPLMRPGSSSD